jgi:hypothetical protein
MGRRGVYRKEDRVGLPGKLQRELVDKAAARHGNCQELAKALGIPKSSVHYYRTGRLTLPASVLDRMLEEAGDDGLERRVREAARELDRTWANYYSSSIMREMYRQKVRLPTLEELQRDDELRRKAAAVVSYVMAEGSIWIKKNRFDEGIVNITLADHETDLYDHFRGLCRDVFDYDIGPPQPPGNGAKAIRGFIYSRFVADWLVTNNVPMGEKSCQCVRLPSWVKNSSDPLTWIAALQPWCDGEGCAVRTKAGKVRGFRISQARHTDLDMITLPTSLIRKHRRHIPSSVLRTHELFGIPAHDYISTLWRSEILDDVSALSHTLGFRPKLSVSTAFLKDDGFWSCTWSLGFPAKEVKELHDRGMVTQTRKKETIAQCWAN